jgi:segregation and condensation protein A
VTSEYFVRTTSFEGPLDLLLHLIRVHEIDIFAIDIFRLTREYLNYLRLMKFNDLQQAGEFLEMAATLVEIKTRMLLPHDEKAQGQDGVEEDDPIRTLQERLLQYETFRNVAEHFSQMPQLGVEIQTNHEWARLEPLYEHIEAPLKGDAATLVVLYEQLLRELVERKKSKVSAKLNAVSLEETIEKMAAEIETTRFALFQGLYNRFQSRYELVVHIMAVLELSKMRRMKFYQQEMFGPVWIYRPDLDEGELPLQHLATPVFAEAEAGEVLE